MSSIALYNKYVIHYLLKYIKAKLLRNTPAGIKHDIDTCQIAKAEYVST